MEWTSHIQKSWSQKNKQKSPLKEKKKLKKMRNLASDPDLLLLLSSSSCCGEFGGGLDLGGCEGGKRAKAESVIHHSSFVLLTLWLDGFQILLLLRFLIFIPFSSLSTHLFFFLSLPFILLLHHLMFDFCFICLLTVGFLLFPFGSYYNLEQDLTIFSIPEFRNRKSVDSIFFVEF